MSTYFYIKARDRFLLTTNSGSVLSSRTEKTAIFVVVGTPNYLNAALILGYSLRLTNTTLPLVCLVSPFVSTSQMREHLLTVYDQVLVSEIIPGQKWANWHKLTAFKYEEYSRILLLGTDLFVQKNIDSLIHCKSSPLCATYDVGLHRVYPNGKAINSDVLVIEPSLQTYKELLLFTEAERKSGIAYEIFKEEQSHDYYLGPLDQAWLNQYFRSNITLLDIRYNMLSFAYPAWFPEYFFQFEDLWIIHFASSGAKKPWIHNYRSYLSLQQFLSTLREKTAYITLWEIYYLSKYYEIEDQMIASWKEKSKETADWYQKTFGTAPVPPSQIPPMPETDDHNVPIAALQGKQGIAIPNKKRG